MDLAMVADIKYGALADIEEAIKKKEAERPENPMLAEVVGPDAIAKVCPQPLQPISTSCCVPSRCRARPRFLQSCPRRTLRGTPCPLRRSLQMLTACGVHITSRVAPAGGVAMDGHPRGPAAADGG